MNPNEKENEVKNAPEVENAVGTAPEQKTEEVVTEDNAKQAVNVDGESEEADGEAAVE